MRRRYAIRRSDRYSLEPFLDPCCGLRTECGGVASWQPGLFREFLPADSKVPECSRDQILRQSSVALPGRTRLQELALQFLETGFGKRPAHPSPLNHIEVDEPLRAIEQVYGPLSCGTAKAALSYSISEGEPEGHFRLVRDGAGGETVTDLGDLLYAFDGDLTVELQKLRLDLLFLHSGVMSWTEKTVLLVADSGAGKSTTCWGLSQLGAAFMSDELTPIDLATLTVLPFLRAIGLKQEPPPVFPLPQGVLRTEWTIHLPLDLLPGGVRHQQTRVRAVVFLVADHDGEAKPQI